MRPGDVVDQRFELGPEAGSGGIGTVYRARDLSNDNPVALKLLRDVGPEMRERFLREAAVLSSLEHPRVVRYVAHGTTALGQPYLAMQWLDGETLWQRLRRQPLDARELLELGAHLAEGLAVVHRAGLVHRDLKPGNLMLVGKRLEGLTLLDFGLARAAQGGEHVTRTGVMLGTPGYMAPEQARGEHAIDARADVFALGCVLFRAATGRAAFSGDDALAILLKVLLEDPPSMRVLGCDVPDELDRLVTRMLAKDPGGRPADGSAVAAELALVPRYSGRAREAGPAEAPSFTSTERRLACMVLSRWPAEVPPQDPDATIVEREEHALERALRATALRFDGALSRLTDGSLLVTLSATGEATDQAVRAARCALALAALLPDSPLALVAGRSVQGVVGDVIERAVGALGRSSAGAIAIDESVEGLLDPRFEVEHGSRGPTLLREKEEAFGTRTLLGKPTPFVGRDRELSLLLAAMHEAFDEGSPRVALVTALAGLGKSRLRYELLRRVPEGVEVWMARGDSLSRGSAFALLGGLLRRVMGLREGESAEKRRTKIETRVSRHLPEAKSARVAAFIGEMVGAPFDWQGPELLAARQDPVLMGDQLTRAFAELVEAECSAGPLLLVLEDLHWGDLPSVRMVEALLARSSAAPLFVLSLARPEVHQDFPKLFHGRELTEVRLGRLGDKAAARLVRAVLGDPIGDDVVARLVHLSAGHAFHLEELIRAVAEGRGDVLPDTVLAMVEARLAALPAEARRVLRAASVFGEVFWTGGVAAVIGEDPLAARAKEELARLAALEVVSARPEAKFEDEEEWVFRHALVRDAAYSMLTEDDRATGHRATAEWLTIVGEPDALVLAEHFERGRLPERALGWYATAAEQALEGNDMLAVLARAERCVACGASAETLGAALVLSAEAHRWRGEHTEAERDAKSALGVLEPGSVRWLGALAEAATAAGRLGGVERLTEIGELMLALAPSEASRGAYVIAAVRAVMMLFKAGRYELAERLLDRAEPMALDLAEIQPAVAARVHRVRATRALVREADEEYLALCTRAATLFESAGDFRNGCMVRINVGFAQIRLGNFPAAEDALWEADRLAERLGLDNLRVIARHNLGALLGRLGRYDEAAHVESAAIRACVEQRDARMEGGSRAYLATILSLAGDHARAVDEAERAVAVLAHAPPIRAFALATLADVLLSGGDPARAVAPAREAMGLLQSLGGIEEGETLVRVVYGESLARTGARAEAERVARETKDQVMARAARIRDDATRDRFLKNVSENARALALASELLV